MPVGVINEARTSGPPALQCGPHSAHSTTGIDGQPLRYNRLMKGPMDRGQRPRVQSFALDKPPERLASYYNPQCSIKYGTDKRVRGTYGGDRTETIMVLLNATFSEPGATFTTADIKDFFLISDLSRSEYMWIQLSQIPERIQRAYNIADFAINERVLVEITKGIYGLPQAALLANKATARRTLGFPRLS